MDRLRAIVLVYTAMVEREIDRCARDRLLLRLLLDRLQREREIKMAGEIRDALAKFKTAHASMTAAIVAEMEKATAQLPQVQKEGIAAVQLPAAMVAATRAEIQQITSEFATQTNGGPHGPLPGEEPNSQEPSANSAPQGSGASTERRPDPSWVPKT